MLKPSTAAKRIVFGIETHQAGVRTRGFSVSNDATRARIERIGHAFVHGYDTALAAGETAELICGLDIVETELRGFAFEGAAMAATLLDEVGKGRRHRWQALADAGGDAHIYMLYVGVGWAFARLPRGLGRLERFLERSDPLLAWLAVDGYGFHHGFFGSAPALGGWQPRFVQAYGARAFDQGLGRSLWFVEGTDVERIGQRVAGFAPERHGDLWSGVGLAAAYAGIVGPSELHALGRAAGTALPQVQQGVAFAATARSRAANMAQHTDQAAQVLCGASAEELARLTNTIRRELGPAPGAEDYERWRRRVGSAAEGAKAS